jgi:hypothetical protein
MEEFDLEAEYEMLHQDCESLQLALQKLQTASSRRTGKIKEASAQVMVLRSVFA